MKNILKLELKKALTNKFFIFSVIILFLPTMMALMYNVEMSMRTANELKALFDRDIVYDQMLDSRTIFNNWVGGEGFSLGSSIFFYIFPLMLAIPYGWSYCSELKSGYIKNMVIRTKRMPYFLSKYIAVFVASGLVVIIPMVANIMLTACYLPAITPNSQWTIYTGVGPNSLMSQLYYTVPFLYLFIYLLIDFVFCGLIGCLSFAVTHLIKNRVVVVLFPFAVLLLWQYLSNNLVASLEISLAPAAFMHPVSGHYPAVWSVIIIEGIILFIATFLPTIIKGRKYEIY
jgi:ABC-type transport system involved in multi-copper enzyme maturation permease subunit